MIELTLRIEDDRGPRTIALLIELGKPAVVGRAVGCELQVLGKGVAERHGRFELRDRGLFYTHLAGSHTYSKGIPVSETLVSMHRPLELGLHGIKLTPIGKRRVHRKDTAKPARRGYQGSDGVPPVDPNRELVRPKLEEIIGGRATSTDDGGTEQTLRRTRRIDGPLPDRAGGVTGLHGKTKILLGEIKREYTPNVTDTQRLAVADQQNAKLEAKIIDLHALLAEANVERARLAKVEAELELRTTALARSREQIEALEERVFDPHESLDTMTKRLAAERDRERRRRRDIEVTYEAELAALMRKKADIEAQLIATSQAKELAEADRDRAWHLAEQWALAAGVEPDGKRRWHAVPVAPPPGKQPSAAASAVPAAPVRGTNGDEPSA